MSTRQYAFETRFTQKPAFEKLHKIPPRFCSSELDLARPSPLDGREGHHGRSVSHVFKSRFPRLLYKWRKVYWTH